MRSGSRHGRLGRTKGQVQGHSVVNSDLWLDYKLLWARLKIDMTELRDSLEARDTFFFNIVGVNCPPPPTLSLSLSLSHLSLSLSLSLYLSLSPPNYCCRVRGQLWTVSGHTMLDLNHRMPPCLTNEVLANNH